MAEPLESSISAYVKLSLRSYNDPSIAYRILVDSLVFITDALGLTKRDVDGILRHLGILVDERTLGYLVRGVSEISEVRLRTLRDYQYLTQRLMNAAVRKRLAAYYTGDLGADVIARVVRAYHDEVGGSLIVGDPFMGSAVLLHRAVKELGTSNVRLAWGIELDPLSCVLGYAVLLGCLGDADKLVVRCGDAFRILWSYPEQASLRNTDMVVTNPPFTRWENLPKSYREFLEDQVNARGYSRFIVRRQLSLQVLSLFLTDSILAEGGLLSSVLPASTFYTIYGEGAKSLLRSGYSVLALIQSREDSFSTGCGFKEIILVARKGREARTAFLTISSIRDLDGLTLAEDRILLRSPEGIAYEEISDLPPIVDANWLLAFNPRLRGIVSLVTELSKRGILRPLAEVLGRGAIVRGVEMYGPDFFLLPNNRFRILREDPDCIAVSDVSGEALEIPKEFLVPALRKPSLYKAAMVVSDPGYFLLSIPPLDADTLPKGLRRYMELGIELGTPSAAMRTFGKYWYSHVYRQLRTKRPFGYLFLPDKVDSTFSDRRAYALMSWNALTATKNFHVILDRRYAPLLTLWFNSALFLQLFVHGSRRISGTWTRFLESDLLRLPIPSRERMEGHLSEAEDLVRRLPEEMSPLRDRSRSHAYREVDDFILRVLGLGDVDLEEIERCVQRELEGMERRD